MDVNDLRIGVTLISLVLFLALVAHTWSRRRSPDHADAALLPFLGGDDVAAPEPADTVAGQGSVPGRNPGRTPGSNQGPHQGPHQGGRA